MITAFAQASDLPQAELLFQEAHRLIVQVITDPASIELGAAAHEARRMDQTALALPIGEDVEALRDHAAEELRTPPAAIEDNGHLPLADRGAHLAQQLWEGFGQGRVELGGDQQ
jgi:anti-sigma factor ChrR (cupin superfamily)